MKPRGSLCLHVLLLLGVSLSTALGQEMTIDHFAGVGARAMGMGGAYIAVAEDFSAIYWNPAGLAQLRGIEAYSTLRPYSEQKISSTFYESSRSDDISRTKLGSVGLVFPYPTYRGSLVFAGGFNRILDFDEILSSVDGFSKALGVRVTESARDEGDLSAFSVGGAVDVSPSVSLGLTVHIWDGSDTYSQQWSHRHTPDAEPSSVDSSGYFTFSDEYDGVSVDLGAMLRGPKGLRFGLTVAGPVRYSVEGDWEEEKRYHYQDGTSQNLASIGGTSAYSIKLPYQFGLGASWTTFNAAIAAGISYADWTQSTYDDPPETGETNADFREKYDDVLRVHLGTEVLIPFIHVKGRVGYYRDPVPFAGPRQEGGPVIRIDDERDFFTLGAGVLIDQVMAVDVAWVFGSAKQSEGSTVDERQMSRLFLSAGYRF